MKYVVLLSLTLLISCADPDEPAPADQTLKQEIFSLVNEHRLGLGLNTLAESAFCENEAKVHSANMASGALPLGHDGFNERFDRIVGETGATEAGENVASGFTTAESVMDAWLNSNGHKANIEGDYTHIGIGIAESASGETFFTQIFAKI